MIDELYWKLVQRKDEIISKSKAFYIDKRDEIKAKLDETWIPYCPEPNAKEVLAVDGGMWMKELRTGTIYAIDAVAVAGRGLSWDVRDSESDVGFLAPGRDARDLVNLLMEVSELKLAFRNAKDFELVLMDGGIKNRLKRSRDVDLQSIVIDPKEPTVPKGESDEERLENAKREQRTYLHRLLSDYKDKLVWISKRSRSNSVFEMDYPDEVFLEAFTSECGYTKPRALRASTLPGTFSYSYVRLERDERVLRVEFFGGEETLKRLIPILRSSQIKGYPVQLIQAHVKARFSRADRKRLESVLRPSFGGPEWWPSQLKL